MKASDHHPPRNSGARGGRPAPPKRPSTSERRLIGTGGRIAAVPFDAPLDAPFDTSVEGERMPIPNGAAHNGARETPEGTVPERIPERIPGTPEARSPFPPFSPSESPSESFITHWTDLYFTRTRRLIEAHGSCQVVYALFMRRPAVFAPRLLFEWLGAIRATRDPTLTVTTPYREGSWVGAGQVMMYIKGAFASLVELETFILQKLGPACVAAYNTAAMCEELPRVEFLAMEARHCAGLEMMEAMAYGASVGSARARRKHGACGFIGNATTATARYFGKATAYGTMPHALIGYAGSTLAAAEKFRDLYPSGPLTVLVDYFGQEVTDTLAVARRFPELAETGQLAVRIDTAGGRYLEGLDRNRSYQILDKHAPQAVRGYRGQGELEHLIGPGVSAAALWHLKEVLRREKFDKIRLIASSGFTAEKCRVMALAQVPVDVIGTGSYIPDRWRETYTTADIVSYNGRECTKAGREFLLPSRQKRLEAFKKVELLP